MIHWKKYFFESAYSMIEEWLFSEYTREQQDLCYNIKVDFYNKALSFLK
jgi:hypothetical protein